MNLAANTEIKMDPSMCNNGPKNVATSKIDHSFNPKLQIKVEQKEEDEAYLTQTSSISDADKVTFKCEINNEIKLEQEELIIKDEPGEVEELGSLEIFRYYTNPSRLGIRDRTANSEIKVDPAISKVDELFKICTCVVQVIRLSEQLFSSKMDRYVNFNLRENVGKKSEEEDCRTQETRPFKCQQCNKSFKQNGHLTTHILFHENKRPFKCQQCGKGFIQNCHLKFHMAIHWNKRPFKCSQCDRSFNRIGEL